MASTKRCRLDILVDDDGDRHKLLGAHRRQIWKYIERFLDGEHLEVSPGIIYPRAPTTPGLKELVEGILNDAGLQVVWYSD